MADENVRIDLSSHADVSGFREMEAAALRFNAAKAESAKQNEILVESERRVRTNLVETVTGLFQARDATEAIASSVTHLSEIFRVGLAGTVIAGVAGAIIEQFDKADERIKATLKTLEDASAKADELIGKLRGDEAPREQEQARKQIEAQVGTLQKSQSDSQFSGLVDDFKRGFNKLSGGALFQDFGIQEIQRNFAQARLQAQITQEGLLAGNPANFDREKKAQAAQKEAEEKARVEENFVRSGTEMDKAEDEQSARLLQEQTRKNEEAARVKAEAEKREQEQAQVKSREAARAEATEQRADEREAKKEGESARPSRIRADIIAGSQRQMGGGGGVFSAITIDPAVIESRKQTNLQQEILNSLRQQQSRPAGRVAIAA